MHEVHKNFRLILNLRFVSKATEKVVWISSDYFESFLLPQ